MRVLDFACGIFVSGLAFAGILWVLDFARKLKASKSRKVALTLPVSGNANYRDIERENEEKEQNLRDFFAGEAFQKLCSTLPQPTNKMNDMANTCYKWADVMVKHRLADIRKRYADKMNDMAKKVRRG